MKPREKKLLVFLVFIGVVSTPFLPIWGDGTQGSILGWEENSGEQVPRINPGWQNLPDIKIDSLFETKSEFLGARRNLFSFDQGMNTDTEENYEDEFDSSKDDAEEIFAETGETEENTQTPTVKRLAGYNYLGYHEIDGMRTAAFSWRGRTFVGTAGKIINDAFEIKNIEENYAIIQVLNGDFEQRLRLKQPAGNTPEKDTSEETND